MSKELTPLQALESIIESFFDKDSEGIRTVRKALKALEIIKREPSEVIEIITTYDTWEEYIKDYPISDRTIWHIIKNKSEFDLLKEVLK